MDVHPLMQVLLLGTVVIVSLLWRLWTGRAQRSRVESEALAGRLTRALGPPRAPAESAVPAQSTPSYAQPNEPPRALTPVDEVLAPGSPGRPPRSVGRTARMLRHRVLGGMLIAAVAVALLSRLAIPSGPADPRAEDAAYIAMEDSWVDQQLVEWAQVGITRLHDMLGSGTGTLVFLEVEARVSRGTLDNRTRTAALQERLSKDAQTLNEADLVVMTLFESSSTGRVTRCFKKRFAYAGRENKAQIASEVWGNMPGSSVNCP
jgi:hypothetical protein